jgi:hypothetical protein
MGRQDVRVVVGETGSRREGLLTFVLEGEGFDVVGSAENVADVSRLVTIHRPDVVVLDDGIGVTAVGLVRDKLPTAKVVLVWPGAVVPIGGDARVEPANVVRDLAPAIDRIVGPRALTESVTRPEWIDRVRKDPGTLREMLSRTPGPPATISVTRLQRRGRPLPPAAGTPQEPTPEEREPAAVVMLPVAAATGKDEEGAEVAEVAEVVSLTEAAAERDDVAAMAAVPLDGPDLAASELNRKLGRIALGGAAVAGALILALSLGGARLAVQVRSAPPVAEGAGQPIVPIDFGESDGEPDGDSDGRADGDGREPGIDPADESSGQTDPDQPIGPDPAPNPDPDPDPDPEPDPDPAPDPDPDPVPDPDEDPVPEPDPDPIPEPDPGPLPDPKPGPEPPPDERADDLPGKSEHNKHGGPPGHTDKHPGKHPKKDMFEDGIPGHAGEHGRGGDSGNAGGNGHGKAWGHQHPDDHEPVHHGNGKDKH